MKNNMETPNDQIRPLHCPRKVYVSGMPVFYRGYNGMYEYQEQGAYYQRVEHKDYCGILIKDTRLVVIGDAWQLQQKNSYFSE